jgi:azurin/glucose/arabinose dehydrogenase
VISLKTDFGMYLQILLFWLLSLAVWGSQGIVFEGHSGIGKGKHIVLVSGDEEYRSEEALPMLGEILSRRYGFKCTVLFAINRETGEIDPNTVDNIPGLSALESANLMIVFTRFRDLPDEQMAYVDAYLQSGKPVIGIRPSVVAFRTRKGSRFFRYSSSNGGGDFAGGFGRQVLGATWISHHGRHGAESTRGIPVDAMADHPILRGVDTMWGRTDVYTVRTPIPHGGKVLVMGQCLEGMTPSSPPSAKPQMPLAWIKRFPATNGDARVFMTTMGDAQDFRDTGFRRMVVNACLWGVGLEDQIPAKSMVDFVGAYDPLPFGFNGFKKGLFPRHYAGGDKPKKEGAPSDEALLGDLFRKGDRICYIGNTLADRMQHFGWVETLFQARYPDKQLVFRNLGFAADELTVRPRSMNFGDPDVHLMHSEADLVFAFFGYNESFGGEAGLLEFRKNLTEFVDHTLARKYNGTSAPRLVLFSPIAHENLRDPDLPDGTENNRRLALYTETMREVAREKKVVFVDLFAPTKALFAKSDEQLTINGIHLDGKGNRQLAEIIDGALNGRSGRYDEKKLERIREAVLNKNLRWFNRYRATDGYSTYGQRAYLTFVNGQSNKDVMDREMLILDAMTANRDRRIWAAAQGRELAVDDSNLPKPIPVKTNLGGGSRSSSAVKEGSLNYLGGKEAIDRMTVAKGMEVGLFASEEQYPELVNPVQMAVDTDGRMWVAAWHTYPHWDPNKELNDKLLIFPDEDGDGVADRCIVFADKLHNPTGFEFWNGGVLVACAPEILFLKDTDGDDRADLTIRLLDGIDSADTHCGANSFVYGPDGYIYFSEGIFHFTNVETPWGKPLRTKGPMLYRFNPRTYEIHEQFKISPNPHGVVIDDWGRLFATDGTSGRGYYVGYPGAGTPHELYRKRVRPVAGFGRISGSHFPEENRGNLLICNTIGVLGILQHKVVVEGADIRSEEIEPIVVSTDGNFRPTDVELGADGALYFLDWHNAIIGHMQHNLRDPSRDHAHGRIYRVTAKGRPLLKPVQMSRKSISELLELLESPEDAVRYRARIELSGRDSSEVLAAARKWISRFDAGDLADARPLTEALWLHEQHNAVNEPLLTKVLRSSSGPARAAATRTLGHWGRRVKEGARLLQERARDPEPLVRAEALVAAAAFEGLDAAEVVFRAVQCPTDAQIEYNLAQTRRVIDPYWQKALGEGRTLSRAGQAFVRGMKRGSREGVVGAGSQDSATNLLHVYHETAFTKAGEATGIRYFTKSPPGKEFSVYHLRPEKSGSYKVVHAGMFKSDAKTGMKSVSFARPWQMMAGDVLAHSGNGGPTYRSAPDAWGDTLYHPVKSLPVVGQSFRPGQQQVLPQKRQYSMQPIMSGSSGEQPDPVPAEADADVIIRTIPEMMRYDLKEFTVKAGKKVKLLLINPDNMPHNVVIAEPGTMEQVGLLADKMAVDPQAAKRHYVPNSSMVLFATTMVDDHSQATLDFIAPGEPGDYPFLCTFPGHWRLMQGVMKVVP